MEWGDAKWPHPCLQGHRALSSTLSSWAFILFLFGVLHNSSCSEKKKTKNITYHILHVFLHQEKFKLDPLPWEKKNQPATYFSALKRNRFFIKKMCTIESKLSDKNPHFEHHRPLFAPNNASTFYIAGRRLKPNYLDQT
jgi:hypothetical protein